VVIRDTRFDANGADGDDGGTTGSEDRFKGEPGKGKGGAIFVVDGATVRAEHVAFCGNTASDARTTPTDNPDVFGAIALDDVGGCPSFEFLGNFGMASRGAGFSSTLTIANTGAVAAPVGSSIIVAFASGGATPGGPIAGCRDSQGNTYSVDVNLPAASNAGALAICSAINIAKALSATDTITVAFPRNGNGQQATANVFAGLASAALDRTHTAAGSGKALSSGTTAMTTQGDELLIRALTFGGTNFNTFTAGEGYTPTNPSQGAGANTGLGSEYRVVSSVGQYAATGSLKTATAWRAAIATYKLQTSGPPISCLTLESPC